MCGIAGMIGLKAGPEIQKKILATMARRGRPAYDGGGEYHCI